MFDYYLNGNDVILKQGDFNLDETLDCGQAFRWKIVDTNPEYYRTYSGFFKKKALTISQKAIDSDIFILHNTSEGDMNIWCDYFDLQTDYSEIKRRYSEDSTLSIACDLEKDLRIFRQDAEECLISFIISQNNNIPRIKGILSKLCDKHNGFPTIKELNGITVDDLSYLKAGFRAKYLVDCIDKITSKELDITQIQAMSTDDARKELMKIKGVGPKVADCVMLFGMYKTDAYPKDVWIKRVNEQFYPNGLPECVQGLEGIAQQYLFHAIRNNILSVCNR